MESPRETETLNGNAQKSDAETNGTQISASQSSTLQKSDDNSTQTNSAHFDIQPDTEDL